MSDSSLTLHHWVLDPFSRQARIAAAEKGVRLRLRVERVWDGRQDFLALNPAGETPVLSLGGRPGRHVVIGARALLEFFEETSPEPPLLPGDAAARAEARRLADWFDRKYDSEVNATLLYELVEKRLTGQGAPDPARVAAGRAALTRHLDYVGHLAADRGWLAGPEFSVADIAAAGHLSCLDVLGVSAWDSSPGARAWWERMRRRPSMVALREDVSPLLEAA